MFATKPSSRLVSIHAWYVRLRASSQLLPRSYTFRELHLEKCTNVCVFKTNVFRIHIYIWNILFTTLSWIVRCDYAKKLSSFFSLFFCNDKLLVYVVKTFFTPRKRFLMPKSLCIQIWSIQLCKKSIARLFFADHAFTVKAQKTSWTERKRTSNKKKKKKRATSEVESQINFRKSRKMPRTVYNSLKIALSRLSHINRCFYIHCASIKAWKKKMKEKKCPANIDPKYRARVIVLIFRPLWSVHWQASVLFEIIALATEHVIFTVHREKTGTFFVRRVLKRFLYYFLNLFRSIWQTFFACSKLSENRLSPDDLCVERRTKNVRNQSSEIRIRSVRFAFELTYQFGTDTPLSVFYELARVIRIRCQSQYL